jgi:hypothetical protein
MFFVQKVDLFDMFIVTLVGFLIFLCLYCDILSDKSLFVERINKNAMYI